MNDDKNTLPPSSRSLQFKFGLRQLFYATALIASGMALSPSTIWFSAVVLLVWGIFFAAPSLRGTTLGWGIVVLALVSQLSPATDYHHHSGSQCRYNLQQMAFAIQYHETRHDQFLTDRLVTLADGAELRHSWRIEILPFIDQQALYDQYDFKEAWNGPDNSKLESLMPDCFSCPYRDHGTKTPYKLVNGPGTAFEVGKHLNNFHVKDGTSNSISLFEDHANPVHWMEPEDITAQEAARVMNSITMKTAAHRHESPFERTAWGCNYATIDGCTDQWPAVPDIPMKPEAFLIDDGCIFDLDVGGTQLREIKYGESFLLATYLLLIVLPAFFLFGSS